MAPSLRHLYQRYRAQPSFLRLGESILGGVILGLVGIVVISEVTLANRIYPGISVGATNLSGLTTAQAEVALALAEDSLNFQGTTVTAAGQQLLVKPNDVGLSYDRTATAKLAFKIGHNPNYWQALQERVLALFARQLVTAQFSYDAAKLQALVSNFASAVNQPPVDAGISFVGTAVSVTPSKLGSTLDQNQIVNSIISSWSRLTPAKLAFQAAAAYPTVFEADALAAKAEAEQAVSAPVKLTWRSQSWVLNPDKIAALLAFTSDQTENNLVSLSWANQNFRLGEIRLLTTSESPNPHATLHAHLNSEALTSYVQTLAKGIDQPAIDAKFSYVDGKLQAFTAEQEGRIVDQEALEGAILSKLGSPSERQVEIPVKVTPPRVTLAGLNNLGIKELLGRGVSRYAGSSAARIQNLSTGAAKVNGTLVPPGETFSMYQTVGDISPETGYAVGLIIANGHTVPGVGGGICQVSTTLFRAALNAGLPIVERNPHAYRVGYYEQNSSPGVDASVYFPYSDFRFKNDTGNYILIQAVNDVGNATLTFDIYGTSDGRQVSLTTPVVSNNIPAPAPLYQNDDTLPKGTVKQIDYAAPGATTVFNRTVTRNGSVISNDSYYTKYQPWQAIFLVGTKEG